VRTGESCYRAVDVPELIYKVNEQWATGCYPFLNPIHRGHIAYNNGKRCAAFALKHATCWLSIKLKESIWSAESDCVILARDSWNCNEQQANGIKFDKIDWFYIETLKNILFVIILVYFFIPHFHCISICLRINYAIWSLIY